MLRIIRGDVFTAKLPYVNAVSLKLENKWKLKRISNATWKTTTEASS
jgi:hypothetical protein